MFARIGSAVVRHPVWVIVGWIVVAAAVIGFAPKLTATSDEASFLPSHYESIQAIALQQKAFPQAATPAALIVLERADGGRLTDADAAKVGTLAQGLVGQKIPNVTIVAFVMALFLTPALTALIGHAAWWPGHDDEAAVPERAELVSSAAR